MLILTEVFHNILAAAAAAAATTTISSLKNTAVLKLPEENEKQRPIIFVPKLHDFSGQLTMLN